MIEIRFLGSGGSGSVEATKWLGDAVAKAGYHSQTFAVYGVQRRGGVVEGYVRLDENPIRNRSAIHEADYLIIMDEKLLEDTARVGTIKKGSTVLINTAKPASAFSWLGDCNVITINAAPIAIGRELSLASGIPIINTSVLGAMCGLIPGMEIDHLIETFREWKVPVIEKNIAAALAAYEMMKKEGVEVEEEALAEVVPEIIERSPRYRDKTPPCQYNCPAGERIERTNYFIEHGQFEEALASIRTENPFPGICGRVCFHPCEDNCNRSQYDEGIAMNAMERAAFDFADAGLVSRPKKKPSTGKKVAVVGSGPAGLSCAYFLALLGHGVTVFEAQPVAGGVPRFGIPEYHLPRNIVDREVTEVKDLGVDIKLNTRVGKDVTFDSLTKEYDACFIAAGAHRPMKLGIPGEDSNGVYSGLDFLKRVALGEKVAVGKRVVVVGGGNVAMDVARTARRVGATEVHVLCLEGEEEMPAYSWEVLAARAEGVDVRNGWGPRQITVTNGKISGVEFDKCVSVFDSKGKFSPSFDKGTNCSLDCDTVITAIGDTLELPFADGTVKMAGPVIEVDALGKTSLAGVYAGGDVASTSRSVVEAIASGKRAALGVDLYLSKAKDSKAAPFREGKDNRGVAMGRYLSGETDSGVDEGVVDYEDLNVAHFTEEPRKITAELDPEKRISDFSETNLGFTKEIAMAEAERCFNCGHCTLCEVCYISCPDIAISLDSSGLAYTLNKEVCKLCGVCINECPRSAIVWEGGN